MLMVVEDFSLFYEEQMISSTRTSSLKIAPTTIMDLPTDCLTLIFNSINSTADSEAIGLTCHKWLQMQNQKRQSLHFQSSHTQNKSISQDQQLGVDPAPLHRLLSRFPNLTSLSLSGSKELTDSSLMDIQHCVSGLRSLRLDCCSNITDNGISLIAAGCPTLGFLTLYRCNVTDTGLESISKLCPGLEVINLSHCQLITDDGVNKLVKNCHRLHGVRVPSCWGIKGTGFDGCSRTLTSIEAYSCDLIPKGIEGMISGGGLEYLDISNQNWSVYGDSFAVIGEGFGRSLKFLNMRFCKSVGDNSIEAIAKGCPLLQEWNLALCHGIELSGWKAIGENCRSLVKLAVYRCRNICDYGLMALGNGCNSLKVLYLSGCSRVTLNTVEKFKMVRSDVEISGEEVVTLGPT